MNLAQRILPSLFANMRSFCRWGRDVTRWSSKIEVWIGRGRGGDGDS
jgi:hypothetical protein